MFPLAILAVVASLWFYLGAEPGSAPPDLPAMDSEPAVLRALLIRHHERARSSPGSAEAHGEYGQALHANQFYRHARVAYGIAARLDPGDYRWPYYQALLAEERTRHDELLPLLEATLELEPRYTPAVLKVAEQHLRREDARRASEYFERARELAGSDTDARLHASIGLARTARARGDWKSMLAHAATSAPHQSRQREVRQLREEALRKLGRHADAERERALLADGRGLEKTPPVKDPLADALVDLCCRATNLMRLANLAEFDGRVELAVRLARRAVEVEPDDADARHFLAYALVQHVGVSPDVIAEARGHRDRGLALRPRYVDLLGKLAKAFQDRQRLDLAIEEVRRYLEVRPHSADMNLNLGTLLMLQRRFEEAIPSLAIAAERDPTSDRARNNLGSALTTLGRLEEAVPYLEDAVRVNPRNQEAQLNLGTVLVRLELPESALPHLSRAVSLKPLDGQARFRLGATLTRLDRPGEALPHLNEAVRLHPTFAVVHESLGRALNQLGRLEEGAEHLREAARLSAARR